MGTHYFENLRGGITLEVTNNGYTLAYVDKTKEGYTIELFEPESPKVKTLKRKTIQAVQANVNSHLKEMGLAEITINGFED